MSVALEDFQAEAPRAGDRRLTAANPDVVDARHEVAEHLAGSIHAELGVIIASRHLERAAF